jgi:FkbM family methyltransferase
VVTPLLQGPTMAAELDQLLSESVEGARSRERSAFDAVSAPDAPLVLFGAGGLGRRTLAGLRKIGRVPVAFVDNNRANWHTSIDGVEVLPPEEAARRYGPSATFVVTIWRAGGPHRYEHSRHQLEQLGCRHIVSFALLYWKHAEVLLPFYAQNLPHIVIEQAAAVREAFELLADDFSRREYVAQVRWRLRADFDGLSHPLAGPQYLADDIFTYRDDEVFVDCGAYDGDTIRSLLAQNATFDEIIALEPDPANMRTLEEYVRGLPPEAGSRIHVMPLAAAARRGTLYIEVTGTASSATSSAERPGTVAVQCVSLDEALAGRRPTFLKMDIEGAEPDALEGARTLVTTCQPVLAICVYHQQDHLWRLPLQMHGLSADYVFFLRPYNEEGWDLVCYGVPRDRLMSTPMVGAHA